MQVKYKEILYLLFLCFQVSIVMLILISSLLVIFQNDNSGSNFQMSNSGGIFLVMGLVAAATPIIGTSLRNKVGEFKYSFSERVSKICNISTMILGVISAVFIIILCIVA